MLLNSFENLVFLPTVFILYWFIFKKIIDKDILIIEKDFYPKLNEFLKNISWQNKIQCFNYNESNTQKYKTNDGHHIDKYGGVPFTKSLCDVINKYLSKNYK